MVPGFHLIVCHLVWSSLPEEDRNMQGGIGQSSPGHGLVARLVVIRADRSTAVRLQARE
jgi:hypothetical protein